MRTIKFRIWDKEKGFFNSDYSINGNYVYGYCEGKHITTDEQKKLVFMQYTGLHDKNGKEIYEGDILKGDWCKTLNDIDIGEVKFYGGAFRFKPAGLPLDVGHYRGECKIIGNIYENKDLLT